jgi:Zn-dependent protease/CBS domain-containing protein
MKWSFQIGTLFGIPIRLHVTFLLLLLVFTVGAKGGGIQIYPVGLIMVALLFGCVLVHELCHSLVAVRKGVPVTSITLLPIGGMAEMATLPEEPVDEVQIAVAGPLASFILAGFILLLGGSLGQAEDTLKLPLRADFGSSVGALFSRLFWANIVLGVLNLVPAFPMDGGRVLRGALAARIGIVQATRWAVTFGQAFAVMLYFAGWLFPGLRWLIVLAIFIYIGAEGEEEDVEFRSEIADVPAGDAMLPRFDHLSPHVTIPDSLDMLRHSQQDDFPVLADRKLVGMVSKNDVLTALREMPPDAVVGEIMHSDFITCSPDTPMGQVFREMERHGKDVVPVLENKNLVGLISFDQIGRYHTITTRRQAAHRKHESS